MTEVRPPRRTASARRLALGLVLALVAGAPPQAQPVRAPTWAERLRALETPEVRRRALAVNVAGTAALVLGRGAVEGEVESLGDGAATLAVGAVAGAGFYAAKRVSGEGRPALALGVAALAGSLAENAATGGGLLGHVRVPLGLADVRVRTPLATRRDGPAVGVEVDPLVVGASLTLPLWGLRPRLRRGVAVFEADDLGGSAGYTRRGRTVGRVVLIEADAPRHVLQHETVHRIQALQAAAVTPAGTLGSWGAPRPTVADGRVSFDVRTEWFYAVNATLWTVLVDYLDRWPEVEARALDEPPPRPLQTKPIKPSATTSTLAPVQPPRQTNGGTDGEPAAGGSASGTDEAQARNASPTGSCPPAYRL